MIKWVSKTTDVRVTLPVGDAQGEARPVIVGEGADVVEARLKGAYGRYGLPLQSICTGYDLNYALKGQELEAFMFEVEEGAVLIAPPPPLPAGVVP